MLMLPRSLLLVALLACAGCTQASDARRDYLLGGPHGWIDLTLHAPAAAPMPASGVAAATHCALGVGVNGETLLYESGPVAQLDAAGTPLGYRLLAPAGKLDIGVSISGCVPEPVEARIALALAPDHLARLEFDGKQVVVKGDTPWAPATLDALHDQVETLQAGAKASDGAQATLTKLLIACVALNLAVLAALLLRRR